MADWVELCSGLAIPASALPPPRYRRPVAVDLFCGAGGMSLGLHQAGFHVAAALELEFNAVTTYLVNLGEKGNVRFHYDSQERADAWARHLEDELGLRRKKGRKKEQLKHVEALVVDGEVLETHSYDYDARFRPVLLVGDGWISHYGCRTDGVDPVKHCRHDGVGYDGKFNEFLEGINAPPAHPDGCQEFWIADASKVTGAEILEALELGPGEVDLVAGGPPCQGFSTVNSKKYSEKVMDPRNSLVFEFMRIALEIQPKAIVMENVPAMARMVTPEGIPVVDALSMMMERGGMGTFDMLRQSLLATAGLKPGAVVRGSPVRKNPKQPAADEAQGRLL